MRVTAPLSIHPYRFQLPVNCEPRLVLCRFHSVRNMPFKCNSIVCLAPLTFLRLLFMLRGMAQVALDMAQAQQVDHPWKVQRIPPNPAIHHSTHRPCPLKPRNGSPVRRSEPCLTHLWMTRKKRMQCQAACACGDSTTTKPSLAIPESLWKKGLRTTRLAFARGIHHTTHPLLFAKGNLTLVMCGCLRRMPPTAKSSRIADGLELALCGRFELVSLPAWTSLPKSL